MLFRVIVEQEVLDAATAAASVKIQGLRGDGTAWIIGNKAAIAKSESILR